MQDKFIKVKKVNAFTDSINGGNPAGVLLDSKNLTSSQMKKISKELKVSETAFAMPSKIADYKLRFFSPDVEVDLCGHATIATFFTMAENGFFNSSKDIVKINQETKAGLLPVDIYFEDNICRKVMMTQKKPIFKGIHIKKEQILKALNIKESSIDDSIPKQIVSTGLFTMPICINSFDELKNINPDFEYIKKICLDFDVGSIFLFTFDTIEKESTYHARCFAPLYGVNEDPVTGTANGAVSAFLVKNKIIKTKNFVCEQGDIIGRSGRVFVEILDSLVKVGGVATFVEEKEILIA